MHEHAEESSTEEKNSAHTGRKIVCYASDGRDFARLEKSAWSVRRNLGDDVEIVLLTESYNNPCVYGLKVINPATALREVGIFPYGWNRPGSFANLYRLAIPLLEEFKDADRVLYMDTDTLVMSPEAKDMVFSADLGGYEVKMVPDVVGWREKNPGLLRNDLDYYTRAVMTPYIDEWITWHRPYCNAGVSIFNLRQIRANGLDWYVRRIRLFWDLQLLGKFKYIDQDCMNVFLNVDVTLDPRLNVINARRSSDSILIRHYAGAQKNLQDKDANAAGYYYGASACKDIIKEGRDNDISDKKQLIVFISHIVNKETIWRYRKLRDDTRRLNMDVVWWYNYHGSKIDMPDDIWHIDDPLSVKEFARPNRPSANIAATHAIMSIAEKYVEYDYIWAVEYDACYSGDWADFFMRMNSHPHDLICEKLSSRYREPGWIWWKTARFPDQYWHWKRQFKALVSVARLSRRLLNKLMEVYAQIGNRHIHYECLWPTVAINEMSCLDMYPLECSREYSFNRFENTNSIVPGKLYHAIKDHIAWQKYTFHPPADAS